MKHSDDFKAVEEKLRTAVTGEVHFDAASRALYATDASNYRQVPIGLVIPKTVEDVIHAMAVCKKFGVPVLTRGAGTSLAGQCCNVAVVIDFSKYLHKILEIDYNRKLAHVQPGTVLDDLRNAVKAQHLTFGPDPATHNRCTFGGMIGNNACGVHSVMAGKTVDNVESLDILTYGGDRMHVGKTTESEIEQIIKAGGRRGEIYGALSNLRDQYAGLIRSRFPKIPRRVSGYNLEQLLPENGFHVARALVGTEGTCVTVLEATVDLIHSPHAHSLLVLGYPDVFAAADDIPKVLEFHPTGVEGLDENFVKNMKRKAMHLPEIAMLPQNAGTAAANSWLLVEFGGETQDEANNTAQKLMAAIRKNSKFPVAKLFSRPEEQKHIWAIRESTFGASVFVPGERDTFAGFEDSSVSPARLGNYLRDLQKLYDKFDYYAVTYGHFGDGCIHSRISFDLVTEPGIQKYRVFQNEAADLVIRYGGSLSGEHGDGQTWGEFLPKMFGPELAEAFQKFKTIWDPDGKMNPGKVVNAYRSDENLRLKSHAAIPQPELHFKFHEEEGNFMRTTQRCIGIAKCLKKDEGVMCPSFMVTHEEKHSTRGRAHLLFEMMRGEVIKGGWHDEQVKDSLDLCLACKGCKSECPVNVDIASYKAEFLSHYYEGRPRPVGAYSFGWIHRWARLASHMPPLANFLTQTPGFSSLAKKIAGIAPERNIPKFASQTFRQWFQNRSVTESGAFARKKILLWPDTFNNYFYPEVAKAAVEVLEASGFEVILPNGILCCGRPLYDFGMLAQAKKMLRQILDSLSPLIAQGIPVVGLEPSCVAVFRDEMTHLFPDDEKAKVLRSQTFLFSEFIEHHKLLQGKTIQLEFPAARRKAIVHGHCHQKSLTGMESDEAILARLGFDFEMPDSGCCGMAGAFGFEKEHYGISMKIGEQKLLPVIRNASKETFIIANGFSCREQIAAANREVFHLAQIVRMALQYRSDTP